VIKGRQSTDVQHVFCGSSGCAVPGVHLLCIDAPHPSSPITMLRDGERNSTATALVLHTDADTNLWFNLGFKYRAPLDSLDTCSHPTSIKTIHTTCNAPP